MTCDDCIHRGRAGGTRIPHGHACFNLKSKKYMQPLWRGHPKCDCFEFDTKKG